MTSLPMQTLCGNAAGDDYPENGWTRSQIEEDARGLGCVRCGNEEAETNYSLCWTCETIERYL